MTYDREQAVTILWRYAGEPESAAAATFLTPPRFPLGRSSGSLGECQRYPGGYDNNRRFDSKTNIKRGSSLYAISLFEQYHQQPAGTGSRRKTLVAISPPPTPPGPGGVCGGYLALISMRSCRRSPTRMPTLPIIPMAGRPEQNDSSSRPRFPEAWRTCGLRCNFPGLPIWQDSRPDHQRFSGELLTSLEKPSSLLHVPLQRVQ